MSETFDRAVQTAVVEAFENMTFMEVIFHSPENQETILLDPQGEFLPVLEPLGANFWLFLPKDLLIIIAENVYVMEADKIDKQIQQDTLAELLNTIAGRIMQGALPEDQLFSLGLPQCTEEITTKPDEILKKWFFEIQENLFYVAFTGKELPC